VKVVSPIRRDRYQGGPGTLTDDLLIPDTDPSALADEPLADLAARFRLRPSAARPGVFAYAAMYTEARRGQPWQVLTPLISYLLQVNPAAVFITLGRNAILESQRLAALGGKPYNARRCDLYYHSSDHVYDSAYRLVIGFLFFWEAETRYGRG
jgi:hypothetical protein